MLISTQVEVVDEHMILLFKNRLSQLSLGQSHYLSGWVGGWVVDKTKIMQCHLLTEVVVEFEDELGNTIYGLPTAFVVPTLDWRFFLSSLRAVCHTLINIGPIRIKKYACVSCVCFMITYWT